MLDNKKLVWGLMVVILILLGFVGYLLFLKTGEQLRVAQSSEETNSGTVASENTGDASSDTKETVSPTTATETSKTTTSSSKTTTSGTASGTNKSTTSSTSSSGKTTTSGSATVSGSATTTQGWTPPSNAPKVDWFIRGGVPSPNGYPTSEPAVIVNGDKLTYVGVFDGFCHFSTEYKWSKATNELDFILCKVDGTETGKEVGVFWENGSLIVKVANFNDGTKGGVFSRGGYSAIMTLQ